MLNMSFRKSKGRSWQAKEREECWPRSLRWEISQNWKAIRRRSWVCEAFGKIIPWLCPSKCTRIWNLYAPGKIRVSSQVSLQIGQGWSPRTESQHWKIWEGCTGTCWLGSKDKISYRCSIDWYQKSLKNSIHLLSYSLIKRKKEKKNY